FIELTQKRAVSIKIVFDWLPGTAMEKQAGPVTDFAAPDSLSRRQPGQIIETNYTLGILDTEAHAIGHIAGAAVEQEVIVISQKRNGVVAPQQVESFIGLAVIAHHVS